MGKRTREESVTSSFGDEKRPDSRYQCFEEREERAPKYSRGQVSPRGKKEKNRQCQGERKKFKLREKGPGAPRFKTPQASYPLSLRRLGLEGCDPCWDFWTQQQRALLNNSTWIRSPPKSSSLPVPLAPEEDWVRLHYDQEKSQVGQAV